MERDTKQVAPHVWLILDGKFTMTQAPLTGNGIAYRFLALFRLSSQREALSKQLAAFVIKMPRYFAHGRGRGLNRPFSIAGHEPDSPEDFRILVESIRDTMLSSGWTPTAGECRESGSLKDQKCPL